MNEDVYVPPAALLLPVGRKTHPWSCTMNEDVYVLMFIFQDEHDPYPQGVYRSLEGAIESIKEEYRFNDKIAEITAVLDRRDTYCVIIDGDVAKEWSIKKLKLMP